MKIKILTVGKTREAWMAQGIDHYLSRLGHYTRLEYKELPDVKLPHASATGRKQAEGQLILAQVGPGERLVLLDENGEKMGSRLLASWMQKQQNAGSRGLVFVVGGAYGFSEEVYSKAQSRISLSALTFPHDLARLVLAEQLYRVFTLLRDESYHHD